MPMMARMMPAPGTKRSEDLFHRLEDDGIPDPFLHGVDEGLLDLAGHVFELFPGSHRTLGDERLDQRERPFEARHRGLTYETDQFRADVSPGNAGATARLR